MVRIRMMVGLIAAVSLPACKEFTSSGDPLSEADAGELAEALVGGGFPGTGGVGGLAAPPVAAAPAPREPADKITITIDDSGPCEGGGTVKVAGTLIADVNRQAQTGTLEYRIKLTPTSCVVTTASNKTFTVTGDPTLDGEGKLEWQSTSFSGELKYGGKFQWTATDGRAGACGVSLTAKVTVASAGTNTGTASASLTGSVCGTTVNRNVTIES